MKIYERVVIDMATLEVVEESAFEHEGPVSECKGGGGSSTTTTVDKEYNRRLAAVAERETDMAEGFYDFWMNNNAELERAKINANMDLLPLQTDLQKDQIASERELLPGKTELGLQQIEAAQELLPGQTAAKKSANELATAQNTASLGLLPAKTEAAGQYLDQAVQGVNVQDRMGKATASMAHQYKDAGAMLRRQAGRMGSNPASGRLVSAMNSMNLDRAKNVGLAQEQARRSAEDENFNRLQGAANFGLPVK